MVAATPFDKAPPGVVTLTDIRSHWFKLRLAGVYAQQLVGLGPVTVAMIPVPVKPTAQLLLIYTSADAVCPAPKALLRILNARPEIVLVCGITKVFLANCEDEVPRPRKSPLETD